MKNVILSACTLLLVLLFSTNSDARIPLYKITGKWVSENVRASPIATINVSLDGYQFYAQISEYCRASHCNWGKLKAQVSYGRSQQARLKLKHRKGSQVHYLTIVPKSNSRIKVITKTVFRDRSGRKPIRKVAYFKRTAMSKPRNPGRNQHQF